MLILFIFLIENLSAAFILWLGIFMITRVFAKIDDSFYWPENPPLFAGIATTLLAIYLFGVAMQTILRLPAEFILWQKLTWWTTPLAIYDYRKFKFTIVSRKRLSMMTKLCSWLVIFCYLTLIGIPQVVYADAPDAANNPIDLTIDENQDGLPDELVVALQQVLALDDGAAAANADATQQQAAIDTALINLSERLPYAPETRSLQERIRTLQTQLNQSQEQTQSEALLTELQNTQAEMMKDPNYALTMNTLATLFAPTSDIDHHDDASLSNHLYLPLISQADAAVQANPVADGAPSLVMAANVNAGPNFNSLKRGHIMLINGGGSFTNFVYVMNYSHSGTYDGSDSVGQWVYESNSDGVRRKSLSKWQEKGKYVALGFDNMLNSSDQVWVLNQGETKYKTNGSTPYNYNFSDKWTDKKLYCSQLVWKMNMLKNIDLDSNALSYQAYIWLKWGLIGNAFAIPAVAPDEVALSGYLTIYSQGKNP